MVNRYYICDSCGFEFETQQPLHENLKKKCPHCGKHKLYQDLTGQYHAIVKDPTSVIQQAERNDKKFGKYELESKRLADQQNKQRARLEALKQMGKVRADATELPKPKKRWYNPENKDLKKELSGVVTSPEKTTKYILEGEK